MLTNEQIINIVKTWNIDYAHIRECNISLILVDRTLNYQFEVVLTLRDNVVLYRQISFCKKDGNYYNSIYLTRKIDNIISVELDYLVITKATEWVKTNINLGLAVEQAVGFDALV